MAPVRTVAAGRAAMAPPLPEVGEVGEVGRRAPVRGQRQSALLRLRGEISPALRLALAGAGVISLLGLWQLMATVWASEGFAVPTIGATVAALQELWRSGDLSADLSASSQRIAIGYAASFAIGAAIGVAVGSFRSVEAFVEPQLGFLRYIPATALTPLLLIWLGIDEAPKVALILLGTVFYNALMVGDVVRSVPGPLINAAYTLGAGRWTVLRRVVLPHSWPGMLDVARINLAAAWLMLVVAELLAANDGLAFRIIRAQRFRRIDRMFALLLVFGLIGAASDLFLRWMRNRTSPWSRP
ncbi:MAG: ABC transporter permease [Actinobacteria bacterium]|nr:ABC transporter permease [Actinomycetota bacterium]MBW3649737.1 ABC transporter permease [Actinomycetota bacterium]